MDLNRLKLLLTILAINVWGKTFRFGMANPASWELRSKTVPNKDVDKYYFNKAEKWIPCKCPEEGPQVCASDHLLYDNTCVVEQCLRIVMPGIKVMDYDFCALTQQKLRSHANPLHDMFRWIYDPVDHLLYSITELMKLKKITTTTFKPKRRVKTTQLEESVDEEIKENKQTSKHIKRKSNKKSKTKVNEMDDLNDENEFSYVEAEEGGQDTAELEQVEYSEDYNPKKFKKTN